MPSQSLLGELPRFKLPITILPESLNHLTKNMMEVALQGRQIENKKCNAENDAKQELSLGVCTLCVCLFASPIIYSI